MKYVSRITYVKGARIAGYVAWPEKYIRVEVHRTEQRTWRALARIISIPNVNEQEIILRDANKQEITLRDVVHSIPYAEHYSTRKEAVEDAVMRIKASRKYREFMKALASL